MTPVGRRASYIFGLSYKYMLCTSDSLWRKKECSAPKLGSNKMHHRTLLVSKLGALSDQWFILCVILEQCSTV